MNTRQAAVPPGPQAAGYTAAWRPSSVPPQAAAFARSVVTAAGPPGRQRAKNLLWAAGRLADWAAGLGLEPVPQVLLHPSVIERFTAHAPGLTGVSRRTLRTNLRFLARPRTVPVLARYHDILMASAEFAGDQLVTGGTDPARHNVSNPLTSSLAGGSGLPRLDTSRLRATWLAGCAELIGLATFLNAAGITCSQRLGDIIAGLQPGGEEQAVALLGGHR